MIKIKYSIKEVRSSIFAVIVPDNYHRAMLFLRAQEFYESPNSKFRRKKFNIWDYLEWYSRQRDRKFTYAADWSGFNLPLTSLKECISGIKFSYKDPTNFTPYDLFMIEIARKIIRMNRGKKVGYVIGTANISDETFMHELCHGLYSTNPLYKKKANFLAKKEIDPKHFSIFESNLIQMGYSKKVILDEIQAYLLFGFGLESFGKGVPLAARRKYNQRLSEILGTIIYES